MSKIINFLILLMLVSMITNNFLSNVNQSFLQKNKNNLREIIKSKNQNLIQKYYNNQYLLNKDIKSNFQYQKKLPPPSQFFGNNHGNNEEIGTLFFTLALLKSTNDVIFEIFELKVNLMFKDHWQVNQPILAIQEFVSYFTIAQFQPQDDIDYRSTISFSLSQLFVRLSNNFMIANKICSGTTNELLKNFELTTIVFIKVFQSGEILTEKDQKVLAFIYSGFALLLVPEIQSENLPAQNFGGLSSTANQFIGVLLKNLEGIHQVQQSQTYERLAAERKNIVQFLGVISLQKFILFMTVILIIDGLFNTNHTNYIQDKIYDQMQVYFNPMNLNDKKYLFSLQSQVQMICDILFKILTSSLQFFGDVQFVAILKNIGYIMTPIGLSQKWIMGELTENTTIWHQISVVLIVTGNILNIKKN